MSGAPATRGQGTRRRAAPETGVVRRGAAHANGAVRRRAAPETGAVQRKAAPVTCAVRRKAAPGTGAVGNGSASASGALLRNGAARKRLVSAGMAAVWALVSWATASAGTTPAAPKKSTSAPARAYARAAAPSPADLAADPAPSPEAAPYHGSLENIAWGGHGELRFGYDLAAGVSEPEWFSVGRVNGFFLAKLGSRLRLGAQASYDRTPDDCTLARAELIARIGRTLDAHAGIFLAPLGRTNLDHDAPQYEFGERSLVAVELLGVPNAELGAGVRGAGSWRRDVPFTYEVDLVTGLDDGIVMDAAGGTRISAGRNNYGDQNGLPALAARFAVQPSVDTEWGFAAQSGPYNQTEVDGVKVDRTRFVHIVATDVETRAMGMHWAAEGAAALVDVPPSLETLYAERQWGVAVEASRLLRSPLFGAWRGTSLSAGLRAEKIDLDARIPGDSRTRVGASLNIRPHPYSILRFGWYYEWHRDRFDNMTPLAGLTLTAASYF